MFLSPFDPRSTNHILSVSVSVSSASKMLILQDRVFIFHSCTELKQWYSIFSLWKTIQVFEISGKEVSCQFLEDLFLLRGF